MLMEVSGTGSVQVITDPDLGGQKTYGSSGLEYGTLFRRSCGSGWDFFLAYPQLCY
jgi:hypothetical protein